MGLPSNWLQINLPNLQLPCMGSGSPLLASISESAAAASSHHSSLYRNPLHAADQQYAIPTASLTKIPSSLLDTADVECCGISAQSSHMDFTYKQHHALRILHLPSEAALRLMEAVQSGVMTVQHGVLSSPPAKHIQQLHSTLLGGGAPLQQDGVHAAHRGLALLQKLHLPRFLHLGGRGGEEKVKGLQLSSDPRKAAQQLHEKGMEYERAQDLDAAAKCYEQASQLEPRNVEWVCRWSKQLTDQTYAPGSSEQQARECNEAAMKLAERALEMDPDFCLAHIAACISKGRLALFSDNKTKVLLAKSAQENAVIALRLDPTSDLAHHLFGRWHYEMAGQNILVRTLVKILFGADLPPGTYHEALEAFQNAAQLRPDRVIHWVEMGRAEIKLGRSKEAIEHLRLALTLDEEDINAIQEKIIGQELLEQLEREASHGLPRW